MKKYFKNVDGDYITATGIGLGDVEITQEEYEHILSVVRSRPTPEAGVMYRLRTDLTFEAVEIPPETEDQEVSADEFMGMIEGVL